MRKIKLIFLTLILSLSFSMQAAANPGDVHQSDINKTLVSLDQSEVLLQALNSDGRPAPHVEVAVFSLNDHSRKIYSGRTDGNGLLKFKSVPSQNLLKLSPGNAVTSVYRAYLLSADDELASTTFSVTHIKDQGISLAEGAKIGDVDHQQKLITSQFTGKKAVGNTRGNRSNMMHQAASTCEPIIGGYKRCNYYSQNYSENTKIGTVNIGSNMSVEFKLTSAATVDIGVGYKFNNQPWSLNGTVNITSDVSTAVDYTIPGTCKYIGSSLYCNLTRDIYAYYEYLYEEFDMYYYNDYEWSEHWVTPISLIGGSSKENWYTNSNNGKPASDVENNIYGLKYEVYNNSSGSSTTTQKYSENKSFVGAAGITTPIGTFSTNVTTKYLNSHEIKWKADYGYKYWIYDANSNKKNWYVTQG